ncbi:MAG: bifunctional glutamate N-acetyltransferase/amino-acid acetyltransferase ArgJ [Oscillatoriales cyanobacterium SM2_2_1]|nr:bifunctional glutamate N-acetyltransferase/amino-acid acetyltransferase ArgJ [Oscillatoriales cyanobacterium SM2_2_1]
MTTGVTAPQGFRAAGITAGLKPSQTPDMALIVSEPAAIAAGVFTTSVTRAACVDYNLEVLSTHQPVGAILCNAGQANACTGAQGWQNAVTCANWVSAALGSDDRVLVASTGVIGKQLDMPKMEIGIQGAIAALSEQGGEAAARAIMTTDLIPKVHTVSAEIQGQIVTVGGMAKGSGMIHPNMATMLAFITTDAAVELEAWRSLLRRAADASFNQITVDGDTSTNDMVLALANGATGVMVPPAQLEAMVTEVCVALAKAIARDGEGATCLVTIKVSGTEDATDARQIARTIAGSALVKSAVFGRDPNWGRIAAAAGRAGVSFEPQSLGIHLGPFELMRMGTPLTFDRTAASDYLRGTEVEIHVSVGSGMGQGIAWGCDLSYDYVRINAEYTT